MGAAAHGVVDEIVVNHGGEDEHLGGGPAGQDSAAGLQAGAVREADVHQHHVGFEPVGLGDGVIGRTGFADDAHRRVGVAGMGSNQRPQAGADKLAVVNNQQVDGFLG